MSIIRMFSKRVNGHKKGYIVYVYDAFMYILLPMNNVGYTVVQSISENNFVVIPDRLHKSMSDAFGKPFCAEELML